MKKKIAALLSLVVLAMALTGCGKFTCDYCGKEKTGKQHTVTVFDEKTTMCDECYKDYKALKSLF